MHIKTYHASSLLDLLEAARQDLGPLAVLLSVRKISRPGEEESDEPWLEGTVGIDPDVVAARPGSRVQPQRLMLLDEAVSGPANTQARGKSFQPVLTDEDLREVRVRQQQIRASAAPVNRTRSESLESKKHPVLLLVGPSGSGKTSTAAKIAAMLRKHTPGTPGLIGLDLHNPQGMAALKGFSRQIELPLALAGSAHELLSVISKWNNRGPLVLDTPSLEGGKSDRVKRIAEALKQVDIQAETHLVLRGDEAPSAVAQQLQNFQPSDYRKVVFTHMDLAGRSMEVLMELMKGRAEVSFLGTGRSVPGDLMRPAARTAPVVTAAKVLHTVKR